MPPPSPAPEQAEGIERAATKVSAPCEAAAHAAQEECAQVMENPWYEQGAVRYPRPAALADGPRCKNVADAALYACNNFGKE